MTFQKGNLQQRATPAEVATVRQRLWFDERFRAELIRAVRVPAPRLAPQNFPPPLLWKKRTFASAQEM